MVWTSPRTWVSGEVPPASTWNTHVRDNLKAIGDAWPSYTPALTNWAIGNGTLVGYAMQAGKLVHFQIEYTAGSTSTFAGTPSFALPATLLSGHSTLRPPVGQATLNDVSASTRRVWHVVALSTTTCTPFDDSASGASSTVPWTWATGDTISINGTYQAA